MPRTARRSFLFLQGPLSPLYGRLADELERHGHAITRINFCFGDWLHWRRPGAIQFRGRPGDWRDFVARIIRERKITDVVLHGDQRPYHKTAAEVARFYDARIIVTELGHIRPDWMTLEVDGSGASSHFPDDAETIQRLAAACPEPDLKKQYPAHFIHVAVPDVVYNLSSTLLWFLYPHYQRHTIYWPPLEYAAWIARLLTAARRDGEAKAKSEDLKRGGHPVFVMPLQLEGDFQIRVHSPFKGQAAALTRVIGSFSRHAPRASHLLVKTHPLDNGLEGWPAIIRRIAREHGVDGRVHMLDGGALADLWPAVNGLVTINSSAGLEAIMAGVPVKTLGPAIYDVAGLTHQDDLDVFWSAPTPPDPALARAFVRALTGTVQVRGTLYSRTGLEAAVDNMARRILDQDFLTPERIAALGMDRPAAA